MVSTPLQEPTFFYPSPLPHLSLWPLPLTFSNTLVLDLEATVSFLTQTGLSFLASRSSPRGDQPALFAVTAAGRSLGALTAILQAGPVPRSAGAAQTHGAPHREKWRDSLHKLLQDSEKEKKVSKKKRKSWIALPTGQSLGK